VILITYNKYKRNKVNVDGITFDSKKEAKRYFELKLLERAGEIKNLELQKSFTLIPSQYIDGKCVERPCKYIADFCYEQDGKTIVEDVKGYKTTDYKIKKKMMLYLKGIQIREY
jgi:hypothetical protein